MAVKFSREMLYEKYGVKTDSSNGSGGNNGGNTSIRGNGGGSSSFSIFDMYEENELTFTNGTDAAKKLSAYDRLFGRSIVDGAGRIDALLENDDWRVDMDVDGDGVIEDGVSIADAIALSCDSELDLYIQNELEKIIQKYGPECNFNMRAMFGDKNSPALVELARLGIRADAVGDDSAWQNRTYAFSLVEPVLPEGVESIDELSDEELYNAIYHKDAKVLEDANGGKGSFIFSDCLIPDGTANGAEINLASILDTMGYECISKADFVENPDEYFALMDEIGSMVANGEFDASSTIADIYSENTLDISTAVRAVYTANGNAYGDYEDGYWGKAITFDENKALIERLGLGENCNSNTIRVNGEEININPSDNETTEVEENAEKQEKADEILAQKVEAYKEDHNGEEPTVEEYAQMVREARQEAGL